jgi:sugar phosphate isomerase/epimerase
MRFGAPVPADHHDLDSWVRELRARRYTAAFSPVDDTDDESLLKAVVRAASDAGIIIAEVGAWSNPLSPDAAERAKALARCRNALWVADRLGANCAVNIAGSRGPKWDGPDPRDLTDETFDMVVEMCRAVIDDVKPSRAAWALEPMPWMYPDSPDSCLRLIKAVDRKAFAAHLDPVNMICSPQRYFANAAFLRECFSKLGPFIRACHGKDVLLSGKLTVHLDEVRPGQGALDYATYLSELNRLDPDTPLLLEHLPNDAEFTAAASHVRSVAARLGISI